MAKENILVIEDEEDIRELISYNLSKEGYRIIAVESGEEGYRLAVKEIPDLILLDIMLPGLDGLEICKLLQNDPKTKNTPIIMLTAKSEESDIVTGLELGADDYITKPFSPKVLNARVRTILRRNKALPADETETVKIQNLVIDPNRHEVLVNKKPINLTLTEFQILYTLSSRPGWVFSRDQLIDKIRGEDTIITDRSIDVQIVGLRKKLGSSGKLIETVRGVGYRFKG